MNQTPKKPLPAGPPLELRTGAEALGCLRGSAVTYSRERPDALYNYPPKVSCPEMIKLIKNKIVKQALHTFGEGDGGVTAPGADKCFCQGSLGLGPFPWCGP